jgi:hypothetical protein
MDRRLLTVLIAMIVVLSPASALFFSDMSDAETDPDESSGFDITGKVTDTKDITFTGKVAYSEPPDKNEEPYLIVLIGVTTQDPTYTEARLCYVVEPQKVKIGSDGSFSLKSYRITDPGLDYYFLIESGYEATITPPSLSGESEKVYRYNSENLMKYSDKYDAYKLVEPVDNNATTVALTEGAHQIGAKRVTGTFTTVVEYDGYKLSNVEVRLLREGVRDIEEYSYLGVTDSNGECMIDNVSTGVYTVVAILDNYDQVNTDTVTILKNQTSTLDVEMVIEHMDDKYWGYDLPHFLMLCGGVVAVALIIASAIIQFRVTRGKDLDIIYNDVKDDEDDENKEE